MGDKPVWAVQNGADENFQDYILEKFPFIKADADARYFNSGVLLVNIPGWIEQDVTRRAVDFLQTYGDQLSYPDQDALNAVLAGKWGELPRHWNKQVMRIGRPEAAPFGKPGIVHYTTRKPWDANYTQAARMVFHRAYLRSGWQKGPAAYLHVAWLAASQVWHKKYAGLMRRIDRFRPKRS